MNWTNGDEFEEAGVLSDCCGSLVLAGGFCNDCKENCGTQREGSEEHTEWSRSQNAKGLEQWNIEDLVTEYKESHGDVYCECARDGFKRAVNLARQFYRLNRNSPHLGQRLIRFLDEKTISGLRR